MEQLAKSLTCAIGSGNLPHSIEQKAKSLLKDITNEMSNFVKEGNKWDEIRVRALRIDMAFNFVTGKYYNLRKRIDIKDYRYDFYVGNFVSKCCEGCKFYNVHIKSNWFYERPKVFEYCENPFAKCPRGYGKRHKAECALVKWLIIHENILIDAAKDYDKQLLYIAQNATQRNKGICGELYKSIQNILIKALITQKTFRLLCNLLTQNHC